MHRRRHFLLASTLLAAGAVTSEDSQRKFDLEAFRRQRLESFLRSSDRADTVMLGDSLTQFGNWEALLRTGRVINRGIAGDGAGDVLGRLEETLWRGATHVFVLVGINDLLRGAQANQVAPTIHSILRLIRDSGTRAVAQSVLPVTLDHSSSTRTNSKVRALNEFIAAACAELGTHYVDLWPGLTRGGALTREFSSDGLHLSQAGYARWAEILRLTMR